MKTDGYHRYWTENARETRDILDAMRGRHAVSATDRVVYGVLLGVLSCIVLFVLHAVLDAILPRSVVADAASVLVLGGCLVAAALAFVDIALSSYEITDEHIARTSPIRRRSWTVRRAAVTRADVVFSRLGPQAFVLDVQGTGRRKIPVVPTAEHVVALFQRSGATV